jgi:hypothetical protein
MFQVMSAADLDGVPIMRSVLGLIASFGGATGDTVASAIYDIVFPNTLVVKLPAKTQAQWKDTYFGMYVTQMTYPMG